MHRPAPGAGAPMRVAGPLFALLMALALMAFAGPLRAEDTPAPAPAEPTTVKIGMYITQLLDFDMSKRSFYAAYWLWFLHDNEKYDPHATAEVTNAKSDQVRFASLDTSKGIRWQQEKHASVISEGWEVQNFPFDRQNLHIVIEDGQFDASAVRFVADAENSRIDPALSVTGWTIEKFAISATDVTYNTSYGDPGLSADSVYSRAVATITIKRDGVRLLCSLFVGFGVGFLLAVLSFFLDFETMAGSRIGLCAASVFAAVGNKYALDNVLPPAPYFTLADVIVASTFASILLAALAIVVMQANWKKRPGLARAANRLLALLTIAGFFGVNGAMIARAVG